MSDIEPMEAWVRRAQEGDRRALEAVVEGIQDQVYNLAVRMLWHPHDAEDARQEILVRIVTKLGSFRGQSSFRTWVWRVAANHLLSVRKGRMERDTSFDEFAADLANGSTDGDPGELPGAERELLLEEVKIGCTLGMLLCLDRDYRLAYILGEVFEVRSEEGAYVLDVTPTAFRKRLSRARERIRTFMKGHCGLVDPANACRCSRRVEPAVEMGRVQVGSYLFAGKGSEGFEATRRALEEMEELERSAAIYRGHPEWSTPEGVADSVTRVLDSGRFATLLES